MDEKYKIGEAKYFLQHMENEQNEPENFRYETSAFLAAARSVLQYAYKEVEGTRNLNWYEERVGATPIFGKFKDRRDKNIHEKPLSLPRIVSGFMGRMWHSNREEEVDTTNVIYNEHFFPDTDRTKDVMELGREYLHELELLVEEGIRRGAIAG